MRHRAAADGGQAIATATANGAARTDTQWFRPLSVSATTAAAAEQESLAAVGIELDGGWRVIDLNVPGRLAY
jgi:type IV secretory pathway VirJ component